MTTHPQDESRDYTLPFPNFRPRACTIDQNGQTVAFLCECPIPGDLTSREADRWIEERSYGGDGCSSCWGYRF